MKGIILSEFVEFLEVTLGEDRAHKIIDSSGVKSVGAYSRVGLYEYQELIKLLTQAVSETCTEADVLVEGFSDHLFKTFKRDASVFFEGVSSAAEMLTQIDNHIHIGVQKLYPDTEWPSFECTRSGNQMTPNYGSSRPFSAVTQAFLGACLKFFGDKERLISSHSSNDQKSAIFVIQTLLVDP